MNMNIVLINPSFSILGGIKGQGGNLIPLNLCYLAAYLRHRIIDANIRIHDAEALCLSNEEILRSINDIDWDIIGITTTTASFESVVHLCKLLRIFYSKSIIVLGGPHVSALPEQSLIESEADIVVIGEGEVTLSEIAESMSISNQSFSDIKGIAYKHKERIHRNEARDLIRNLDELPFPARDLVDNSLYSPPPTKRVAGGSNTMISTSRGCPYNCGFCGARSVWGRGIRFRSPQSVIAEISDCINNFGIKSINFTDEFFTAKKQRTIEICRSIVNNNLVIPWVCSARAQDLDDETLLAMKEAGCREISFGIESGNTAMLKIIDKNLDLVKAAAVINRVKNHGIGTHASYIFGYIGETRESIADTIKVAKEFGTDIAAFFIAVPLPGTRLYAEAMKSGYIRKNATWKDYAPLSNSDPVMDIPTISNAELVKWQKYATRSYYLRLSYILKKILRLRHWYEIKNTIEGLKILLDFRR